jgi:type II secretion system protein N
VNARLKKALPWIGYAAFYVFVLSLFAYLTFPYERLKERIVAEFNARQLGGAGMRLELEELDGYWLSGIEAEGVRLVGATEPPGEDGKTAKPKVLTIDEAHARVSLLRLLFGTTHVNFGADAFGGEISGHTSDNGEQQSLELELEELDVSGVPMLEGIVGLPLTGKLQGKVDWVLPEGKLSKAEGKLELIIVNLTAGDGKAKIRDTIALPKLDAGELTLKAEATDGRLDVKELSAKGPDLELVADGKVRLREPFESSLVEMSLRFKFTERYTNKNDMTRGLFGAPGSSIPGVFDLDPKNRRAKRPDGFYSWRLTGPIAHLNFEPAALAGASSSRPGVGNLRGFSPRSED